MPHACDYSVARPEPAALAAAGIVGVVRYATRFGFDKAEYDALLAAGLRVALVMEWGSQPALRGPVGGTADAREAEATAAAVGYPPDATVYYVAEDPNRLTVSDWPLVVSYFQAVKAVNPARRRGAYGSQALVAHLQQLGLVTYGWMVSPWSGVVDGMHLAQMVQAPPPQFAGQIDIDVVLQDDWGQAPRKTKPTPPPAPTPIPTLNPQKEKDMFVAEAIGPAVGTTVPGSKYLCYPNRTKYIIETPADATALCAALGQSGPAPLTCGFLNNMTSL